MAVDLFMFFSSRFFKSSVDSSSRQKSVDTVIMFWLEGKTTAGKAGLGIED
jgi:hypothetical protein